MYRKYILWYIICLINAKNSSWPILAWLDTKDLLRNCTRLRRNWTEWEILVCVWGNIWKSKYLPHCHTEQEMEIFFPISSFGHIGLISENNIPIHRPSPTWCSIHSTTVLHLIQMRLMSSISFVNGINVKQMEMQISIVFYFRFNLAIWPHWTDQGTRWEGDSSWSILAWLAAKDWRGDAKDWKCRKRSFIFSDPTLLLSNLSVQYVSLSSKRLSCLSSGPVEWGGQCPSILYDIIPRHLHFNKVHGDILGTGKSIEKSLSAHVFLKGIPVWRWQLL